MKIMSSHKPQWTEKCSLDGLSPQSLLTTVAIPPFIFVGGFTEAEDVVMWLPAVGGVLIVANPAEVMIGVTASTQLIFKWLQRS